MPGKVIGGQTHHREIFIDIQPLTLERLQQAVRGQAAAVRLRIRLQPAGGPGAKVFPPQTINVPDPLRPGELVRKGNIKVGGVTIDYAEQTTVLSLAALRRLRFPIHGQCSSEANDAGRTVLAALALAAIAHQMDPADYFLRSNCQLVVESNPEYEMVRTASDVTKFGLTAQLADGRFAAAVSAAKKHDLLWREGKIPLQPKKALVDLVKRSRELGGETEG